MEEFVAFYSSTLFPRNHLTLQKFPGMQTERLSITSMALYEAVKKDDTYQIAQLLSDGAKTDGRDETGNSVLHVAVSDSLGHIVRMLLKHGADPNVKNNRGDSPLHLACSRTWENGRKTIIKHLLLHGAHVNAESNANLAFGVAHGRTPLHVAIDWVRIDVVELLLAHGADMSIQEGSGYNSLHWAVQCHAAEVCEERHRSRANPSRRGTPTHIAKTIRVVQILLAHGVDSSGKIARLTATTNASETVEDLSCTEDMKEILRYAMVRAQEEHRSKLHAFSMGYNARLGAASQISALDPEVIQMIMDRV
jgi:ankyrin repeat protein